MAKQAEAQGMTQDEAERGFLTAMRPTSLLGRFATTDEVASMIVYTCSEQASATSGAALRVDGGVVRFVSCSAGTTPRRRIFHDRANVSSRARSAERRVGQEWVSTCRSRWS